MIPIVMVRRDLEGLSPTPVPPGFAMRLFRLGDEDTWARVQAAAGAFGGDTGRARLGFAEEFSSCIDELGERCLFLVSTDGEVVGTTMAWRDNAFQGQDWGRIHWVAVAEKHQGQGLGRLLVTEALSRLRLWHRRAYLTTQTSSWIAVHLYLSLGFVPFITAPGQEEGWALLRREAPHALLGPAPYLA